MDIRTAINLIEAAQPAPQWPKKLNDAEEIAEYIEGIAGADVDVQWMIDYFHGGVAVLRLVDLSSLTEGDPNGNLAIPGQDDAYARMDPATMPPLVVEGGRVIDGNHRYRAAKKLGLTQVWVYDVVEPSEA
ncbi:MAG: hypothetical protein EOP83_15835 [Verrucomicrobiaceae bacterium]|nr:MAG: hypothetical protein EOP83_15835 [Verrucomicrobiaceae bacterium]